MQSSLWKLAVIAGVVGLCSLVIINAQKDMAGDGKGSNLSAEKNDDHSTSDEDLGEIPEEPPEDNEAPEVELASGGELETDDDHGQNDDVAGHDPFGKFDNHRHANDDESESVADSAAPLEDERADVNPRDGQDDDSPSLLSDRSDSATPLLETVPTENDEPPVLNDDAPSDDAPSDDAPSDDVPEKGLGLFDAAALAEEERDAGTTDSYPPENTNETEPVVVAGDSDVADSTSSETPAEESEEPVLSDDDPGLPGLDADVAGNPGDIDPFDSPEPFPSAADLEFSDPSDELPSPEGAPLSNRDAESEPVSQPEFGVEDPEDAAPRKLQEFEPAPAETLELVTPEEENENAEPVVDNETPATDDPESFAEESLPATDDSLPAAEMEEDPQDLSTEELPTEELPTEELPTEEPPLITLPDERTITPNDLLRETNEVPLKTEPTEPTKLPAEDLKIDEPLEVTDEQEAPFGDPLDDGEESKSEPEETATAPTPKENEKSDPAEEKAAPAEEEEAVYGEGTVDKDAPRGAQKPQLTIEKVSPSKAVLNKPFIYSIIIRNLGKTRAGRVVVEDEIPRGARLTGTIPQAELAGKKLIWKLGTLNPGQQRKISIRVIPVAEGEIGSVATVNFVAEAAAKTIVTKPELKIDISAPKKARLGQPIVFQFKVSNTGTVNAKKVVLRNILPTGLKHPGGNDLEYEVGDLQSGQSRDVSLTLTAVELGKVVSHAVVTAEGGISAVADAAVQIADQGISIIRSGPKQRLLKRPASFTNSIKNKAKEPVSDVVVVENIPEGMKFVKASPGGNFDPKKKTVTWRIQQIAGEQTEDVSLMLLPESPGVKQSIIRVFGEEGQIGKTSATTAIRGFSMLMLEIDEAEHPLEIGERFSYRVRIRNRGTEAATGVLTSILLPEKMKFVSTKGPVKYTQAKQQLDFSAIKNIPAQQQVVIDVLLEAKLPGDSRLQVQIQSDQMKKPFNRETSTLVFSDQE